MTRLYFALEDALVAVALRANDCRCEFSMQEHEVQCVAIDPLLPHLIYCGTFNSGLWRSEDAGVNWRPVGAGIDHPRVLSVVSSQSERANGSGVVYAGTEPSALFRSEDRGETWRQCVALTDLPSASEWSFPPRPETHHVRWIEPDTRFAGRLLVAIEAGALVRSTDAGFTWLDRTPDGPRDTHQIATFQPDATRLYSAAGDGCFASRDGGATWQRFEEGLQHKYLWSIAVDRGDADNLILSAAASPQHSHSDTHPESHLYRRTTGAPWKEISEGLPDPRGRHSPVVASHPSEPGLFFAAWEQEVFRSIDGGACWERLDVSIPDNSRINELCALVVAEAD